jgi:hypothetical protein
MLRLIGFIGIWEKPSTAVSKIIKAFIGTPWLRGLQFKGLAVATASE